MTRAEAIALANAAMYAPDGVTWASSLEDADRQIAENRRSVERFVDAAVALGLLKFEEPKSPRQRFISVLTDEGYLMDSPGMREALKAFDAAVPRTPQESITTGDPS